MDRMLLPITVKLLLYIFRVKTVILASDIYIVSDRKHHKVIGSADTVLHFSSGEIAPRYKYYITCDGTPTSCNYIIKRTDLKTNEVITKTITDCSSYTDGIISTVYSCAYAII